MISNAKVSELEESLLPNLKKGSKRKKCFVSEEGLKKIICNSKKSKASILCQSLWLDIPMYTILKQGEFKDKYASRRAFKTL